LVTNFKYLLYCWSNKETCCCDKRKRTFVTVWQSDGQDGDNYGIFGEFGPKICCADFSGDLFVNFRDFVILAEEWLQEGIFLKTDLIDDKKSML